MLQKLSIKYQQRAVVMTFRLLPDPKQPCNLQLLSILENSDQQGNVLDTQPQSKMWDSGQRRNGGTDRERRTATIWGSTARVLATELYKSWAEESKQVPVWSRFRGSDSERCSFKILSHHRKAVRLWPSYKWMFTKCLFTLLLFLWIDFCPRIWGRAKANHNYPFSEDYSKTEIRTSVYHGENVKKLYFWELIPTYESFWT